MKHRALTLGALLVATALAAACGSDGNDDHSGGAAAGGNGGSGGSGAQADGGGSLNLGGSGGTSTSGDADVCAAESHTAKPSPVDILIMLDQSTSMANKLPNGQTLWEAVSGAIGDFLVAPEASGIGVGIQYFGLGTGTPSCNVAQYATPEVPITELPGAAPSLQASLAKHYPQSFTPTGPALQGALQYAQAWAAAHTERTTFVVLATDGYPTECDPQSMTGLGALAAAALNGTPRVFTFVVGIGSLWNLNAVAKDGGTREAMIISDTSANAGQELTSALLSIATAPLACDYPIPVPADGGTATVGKINVEFTPPSGGKQTLVYVPSAADCSKVSAGWYYDNPSAPTRIMICPKTCTAFGTGTLDILLGCDTIVVS
jgi:von Willebrand factor type A domain